MVAVKRMTSTILAEGGHFSAKIFTVIDYYVIFFNELKKRGGSGNEKDTNWNCRIR